MLKPIFLDHNATTPISSHIKSYWGQLLEECAGNASSVHGGGRKPKQWIRQTRQALAKFLAVNPLELIFTSGASEANNTVINTWLHEIRKSPRKTILSTSVEHPSIMEALRQAQERGDCVWKQIPVCRDRGFDWQVFEQLLDDSVFGVTTMFVNNETGYIFPLTAIAEKVHANHSLMHSDVTQAFGKIELPLTHCDYFSFSAHKAYALKGCGILGVKKSSPYHNLIWGGAQERYRRAGTENVLAIASLGLVLPDLNPESQSKVTSLRDYFEKHLLERLPNISITHVQQLRTGNTSHLLIAGVDGESLLMSLDLKGYAVSTGAACSSGSSEPSPVLLALGFSKAEAQQSLRVSFGIYNQLSEVDSFIDALESTVKHLRKINVQGGQHDTK